MYLRSCLWRREVFLHLLFVEEESVSSLLFAEHGNVSTVFFVEERSVFFCIFVCGEGEWFNEGSVSTHVVCGGGECFYTRCLWRRGLFLHSLVLEEGIVFTLLFDEEGSVSTLFVFGGGGCYYTCCLWRRRVFLHYCLRSRGMFLQSSLWRSEVFFHAHLCVEERSGSMRGVFQHMLFVEEGSVSTVVVC